MCVEEKVLFSEHLVKTEVDMQCTLSGPAKCCNVKFKCNQICMCRVTVLNALSSRP